MASKVDSLSIRSTDHEATWQKNMEKAHINICRHEKLGLDLL